MRNFSRGLSLPIAAWLLTALPAFPQTNDPEKEEMVVDRLEASGITVPKGSLQVENGLEWTRQFGDWALDGTQTDLRLGIGGRTEVELDVPDYYLALGKRAIGSGFGDLRLGMKQQLFETDSTIQVGILPSISLPTGSDARSGHTADPELQIPISVEPDDVWSFGVVLSSSYLTEDGRRLFVGGSELYVDRGIGKRFETFIAHVGEYPRRGSASHAIEFGGAYLITPRQQIDSFIGLGLSRAAPGVFFGIGYAVRFDGLMSGRSRCP